MCAISVIQLFQGSLCLFQVSIRPALIEKGDGPGHAFPGLVFSIFCPVVNAEIQIALGQYASGVDLLGQRDGLVEVLFNFAVDYR